MKKQSTVTSNGRTMLMTHAENLGGRTVSEITDLAVPEIRDKVQQVFDCAEQGEPAEAVKLCDEILQVQPDFPDIEYTAANMLFWQQGEANLNRAYGIVRKLIREQGGAVGSSDPSGESLPCDGTISGG